MLLFLLKEPVEIGSTALFIKIIPANKFPLGSDSRQAKAVMLGERIFKLIINIGCVSSLVLIMSRDDCDFMDVRTGGRT